MHDRTLETLFPKLKLPSDVNDCGLVLATGPSFDDFDLDGVRMDSPNVFGCGAIYRWKWPKNYIVTDVAIWEARAVPHGFPSGLTVWARPPAIERLNKLPSAHRPACIREIPGLEGWNDQPTAATAILAASNRCDKVYVLGMDAGHSWDWTPRRRTHGMLFTEANDLAGIEFSVGTTFKTVVPFLEMRKRGAWDKCKVVNLSTTSYFCNILEHSEEARRQRFGNVDRYSRLFVAYVGKHSKVGFGMPLELGIELLRECVCAPRAKHLPGMPLAVVANSDDYSAITKSLDTDEILRISRVHTRVKSHFTHVVPIGDWAWKMILMRET
jgi:hypothetical protein